MTEPVLSYGSIDTTRKQVCNDAIHDQEQPQEQLSSSSSSSLSSPSSELLLAKTNNKNAFNIDPAAAAAAAVVADPSTVVVNLNTRFAADRTYMAADRTAIAWVRTAISMIGFGVTIAKTADVLQNQGLIANSNAVKAFGVIMILMAWWGLVLVIYQNIKMERRLAASGYGREDGIPLGLAMAVLVLVVGIVGAVVMFHPIQ